MSSAKRQSVSRRTATKPLGCVKPVGTGRLTLLRKYLSNLLLLIPFVVLSLIGAFHHEPWRDETHNVFFPIWCESILDIFVICNQTGAHPPLWYLIIRGWSFFNDSFLAMALLHWGVMFAALGLLVCFSPFKWYEKLLISLGYFFLYEYCVIVRNYGINVLFLFMILAMYPRRLDHLVVFSVLIALLAFSNLFGIILAGAITLTVMYEVFQARRSWVPLLIPIATILVSFYICTPQAFFRQIMGPTWPGLAVAFANVVAIINNVFFTGPVLALFGNASWARCFMALVLSAFILILAPRHRVPLIYFCLSFALLLGFYAAKGNGMGLRHQGFFYINLIYSMWLDRYYANESEIIGFKFRQIGLVRHIVLVFILLLQAWIGINAVLYDYKHIYSDAQNAGRSFRIILEGKDPKKTLIATFLSGSAEGLQGFLGSDQFEFYSLELMKPYRLLSVSNDLREWMLVEPNSRKYTLQEVIERFLSVAQKKKYTSRYLIFPSPLNVQFKNGMRLVPVYQTMREDVMWGDERFYIYRLDLGQGEQPSGPGSRGSTNGRAP